MNFFPSKVRAFSLPELLLGLVCLGLALAPLLAVLSSFSSSHHQLGLVAREQAWNTFQDQTLGFGLDPTQIPSLLPTEASLLPSIPGRVPSRSAAAAAPGQVTLRALRAAVSGGSFRQGGSGWELGAGPSLPPVEPPVWSSSPVVYSAPEFSPHTGSTLAIADLQSLPSSPGMGARLAASSNEGGCVFLQVAGLGVFTGESGAVSALVPASLIAQGLLAQAWVEFPGKASLGHLRQVLPDGRSRWSVPVADNQLQIYEPSECATFTCTVDCGAPLLAVQDRLYGSGVTVPVSYPVYVELRGGSAELRVIWPSSVQRAFGDQPDLLASGFLVAFQGAPGPRDGTLVGFFQEECVSLWEELSTVTAIPLLPPACVAKGGEWFLYRERLVLPPPECVPIGEEHGAHFAGERRFHIPDSAALFGFCRLSARGGALMSTNPVLVLTLEP